ncbi:MAG TPA: tetratricopeptide repeat protein [Bacteroidetes bacterium]|nr:tetratricopeptide repeat protein [Bacteroidota bacterium]HIL58115.1 tetratricopeptide repeat protein [Rhodothermales bacterium]
MRSRLTLLPALLAFAVLLGGADGCSSDPNVESAKLALRQENYEEAREQLGRALETNPENVEALALLPEVIRTQMDAAAVVNRSEFVPAYREAIANALRVAPEDPDVMNAKRNAWASFMNNGNQTLTSEATPASDAIPFFEGAIEVGADSASSHFSLGLAQLLSENNEAAASSFETTLELDPSYTNASIYLARAYLMMDRGAEALDVLSAARENIEEGDEDADRLEQEYLNALASSGQTERAISEFEEQVENFPDDPLIRYNYGTLLLNVDRFSDAIEQFEAATELDAENADAYYNLGVANLREAGRVETEAGELTLDQQDEYDALIAQRDEYLDSAIASLEMARDLTDDANRPAVCNSLLQIYNARGMADEAEAAAECAGVSMD